jgi:hypothetical protein
LVAASIQNSELLTLELNARLMMIEQTGWVVIEVEVMWMEWMMMIMMMMMMMEKRKQEMEMKMRQRHFDRRLDAISLQPKNHMNSQNSPILLTLMLMLK